MHRLPANHNRNTHIGEKIYQQYGLESMEVTQEVFESSSFYCVRSGGNRLHTIKARISLNIMKIVIALQAAAFTTADFSFDVLGAESEGMIGYLLEPAHKTA